MRFTFLTFLLAIGIFSFAQSPCGTILPTEYDEYLRTKDRSYLFEKGTDATVLYIPIQYHIVGNDSGQYYHALKDVIAVHCALNTNYASANIQFFMANAPSYINSTYYYNDNTTAIGSALKAAYNLPNVCNVYITNSAAGNCGYTIFPGGPGQGIILNKSCDAAGSTTLTHEMGHYLNLPHTFNGWEGRDPATAAATNRDERVDGSNCSRAGDYFCDTHADFQSQRWNCPYTGAKVDFHGDLYNTVLDGGFYMSYSNDACMNKFSPNQKTEMYRCRQATRTDLDAIPLPSFIAPAATSNVYPASGASGIATFSKFRWNKSEGATHYHLLVSTVSSFAFTVVDKLVTDTFFTMSALRSNNTYYWKVMPATLGSLCNPYSTATSFRTTALESTLSVSDVTCAGSNDGSLFVDVSGGTAPYSYTWSSGQHYSPITDLSGGTYSVTVTDLAGRTLTADLVLHEPAPIVVNVHSYGANSLIADVTGGNGSYTYHWSNGASTAIVDIAAGPVSVTVTDQLGCQGNKSIIFNGIVNDQNPLNYITLSPNPVSAGEAVLLKVEVSTAFSANIVVYTIDGKTILQQHADLQKGNNAIPLSIASLASGSYFISLNNDQVRKTIPLFITR